LVVTYGKQSLGPLLHFEKIKLNFHIYLISLIFIWTYWRSALDRWTTNDRWFEVKAVADSCERKRNFSISFHIRI